MLLSYGRAASELQLSCVLRYTGAVPTLRPNCFGRNSWSDCALQWMPAELQLG